MDRKWRSIREHTYSSYSLSKLDKWNMSHTLRQVWGRSLCSIIRAVPMETKSILQFGKLGDHLSCGFWLSYIMHHYIANMLVFNYCSFYYCVSVKNCSMFCFSAKFNICMKLLESFTSHSQHIWSIFKYADVLNDMSQTWFVSVILGVKWFNLMLQILIGYLLFSLRLSLSLLRQQNWL